MPKYTVTELQTVLRHVMYMVEAGSASAAYDIVQCGDGGTYMVENDDVVSSELESVDRAEEAYDSLD